MLLSRLHPSFRGAARHFPLRPWRGGGESRLQSSPRIRTSSAFSKQAALKEQKQQQQQQRRKAEEEEKEARQKSKRLTTTMDEFFAQLGASNTGGDGKVQSAARRPRILGHKEKTNESSTTSTTTPSSLRRTTQGRSIFDAAPPSRKAASTQLADMNSFFDEVNKVVAQNKKKETAVAEELSWEKSPISPLPSILDLMPPVREGHSGGPNAFEEQSYDDYRDMVDTVMTDPYLFRKKGIARLDQGQVDSVLSWLRADERMVEYQFPSLDQVLTATSNNNNWDDETLRNDLQGEIHSQKQKFQVALGWNNVQYELATRALHRIGNLCAKKASGPPGEVAWEKLKEAGFCLKQDIVQNYLYVISTFSTSTYSTFSGKGSVLDLLDHNSGGDENKRVVDEEPAEKVEGGNDVATEVALLHDILFGASEESTTIRVRRLVWERRAAEAEALLDKNAVSESCHKLPSLNECPI